ncbi:minor tail protein [Rhodococcus phage Trina]|uniref:Minor tail protein n=1 Tax=Rhodococcus phage Trina TaxID=2027905 RepID=A0A2D1ADX6_9CAUD|nr:minor tail protein [Rhodococcus phage Trina]ASZ74897.1 minor tail protein [Rhodococcus phage Trina]
MQKPLLNEYVNELDYNHDIHGTPKVVAELNWNQTKFLADPAKRGSHVRVFDGTGINPVNETGFNQVFQESRYKKSVYSSTVNWYEGSNKPQLDWVVPPRMPGSFTKFGAEQTFYIDVQEPGTWKFFVSSDDGHDLTIYSQTDVPTKVTSYYGGRFISFPPNYTESGTYNFPTVGRYKVRARVYNNDIAWGIFIGYQTPTMIAASKVPVYLTDLAIRPDQLDAPFANPVIPYNPYAADTKEWKEWREFYPVDSIIKPHRPESGIRYNELDGDAYLMSYSDFIVEPGGYKLPHYYTLNKKQQTFAYWKTDTKSAATGNASGYPISNADVTIFYNEPVPTNKIVVTNNIGPVPTVFAITYRDEAGVWHDVVKTTDVIAVNQETGRLEMYINELGNWTEAPVIDLDYSVNVTALRYRVERLNARNSRLEVLELSARKELDITDRIVDFSVDNTMDEADFLRIIGSISSNSGSVTISNWDGAFNLEELAPITDAKDRLNLLAERQVKFTFDLLYDLKEQGELTPYPVRLATMYASDWSKDGEFDYSVNLFDSAKYLMNVQCPDLYEKDMPIHILIAQILDSVGFSQYRLDKEDYSSTSPVLDFFSNKLDATVWEVLQELCTNTMSAIYMDEYDVLQLITRDKITKAEEPVYTLRGQTDNDGKLPNIITFDKNYDMEANKVKITWKPKKVKTNKDPIFPEDLTDILWQSNETITLRATRLVKTLAYEEENEFWIDEKEAVEWPYKGKANINGEMVAWDGKEYYFRVRKTPINQPPVVEYQTRVVRSKEELDQCIAMAKDNTYQYVNKFTGKIMLRRDEKTNVPTGRAIDPSKYRVAHPVNRRPGWIDATTTIGQQGIFPGFWPGEQSTSWYTQTNSPNQTSIEINRPTNRSDDWFKNQILMRKSELPLQQWGARIKFKNSTTIGELNFMFNMGQSFGNSEVVTTAIPALFNQYYNVTFLETQNLVRNATHEIAAWVVSPDPVYRTWDNAIRGSASRMYNRNYWDTWAERMKGYQFEFKRDTWYDIKIDLTRGRGYNANSDMHFFIWINGMPVGGFNAAGPANRHKWLARTNYWAIGSRAASKVEVESAYSWTEFDVDEGTLQTYENFRYDYTNGGYLSTYLEDGVLYPSKGKTAPYRDGAEFNGEFFFDDFGGMVHEIRDFEVNLDKAPAMSQNVLISNEGVRELDLVYNPNKARFSLVNITNKNVIAHGEDKLPGGDESVNHSIAVYGYVLTEEDEQTITRENRDSIKDRGEVKLDLQADWINTKEQADQLAKWVVKNFAEPKDVVTVEVFGDASFSIGDKLNVLYEKAGINPDWLYIVTRCSYSYSVDGLKTELEIRRVRNNYVPSDDEM